MVTYSNIRTRALREMLAQTSFADAAARDRIDELMRLEEWLHKQPHGMAANVSLFHMRRRHPVETVRFLSELRNGIYMEEQAAKAHAEAAQQARDEAHRLLLQVNDARRAEELARVRDAWLAAGGRP
ncbi:hypothetical protein [Rhodopila globiformis]|uniref:Uncharacterized protein n=1 Tax=Rhodopila globiformis TaxID=1071 RepID=A0A2S6N260_RHOGL|nr:hypothetical protein [Rhodopila globiformis]PPQ28705.1 hypothetical protein CCS01_23710 [Rhodopila globiformis]